MRNKFNLWKANQVWLERDDYPHDPNKLGVSQLNNPTRQIIIQKNFYKQLLQLMDVSDRIPIKIGEAIHKDRAYAMADSIYAPQTTIEKRYEINIDGIILSGQPDMFAPQDFFPILCKQKGCNKLTLSIEDLKTTSIWTVVNIDNRIAEYRIPISAYRYILFMQRPSIVVDEVGIISILCKDWTENSARKAKLTGCAIQEIPVDLEAIPVIEKFIKEKIRALKVYWNCTDINLLPPCTEEEKAKFNKYKDGRYKKCAMYCDARHLCYPE